MYAGGDANRFLGIWSILPMETLCKSTPGPRLNCQALTGPRLQKV